TSAGNSAYTATAIAQTPAPAPAAPSGLVATPVTTSQIDLTWTDNSGGQASFLLERQTGSGAMSQVALLGPGATSYSDTGLAAGTQYGYVVIATNTGGDSAPSNTATATTPAPAPVPTTTDVTLGTGGAKSIQYTDPDGTTGVITFNGPGSIVLHFSAGTVVGASRASKGKVLSGRATIVGISAVGTTTRSTLTLSGRGGDRLLSVGSISASGAMGSIMARNVDVTGDVNIAGGVRSVHLHSAHGGNFSVPSAAQVAVTGDFADQVNASALGTFTAGSISSGDWSVAGAVGVMRVVGSASFSLTAAAMRSMSVGGGLTGSTLTFTSPASGASMSLRTLVVHGLLVGSTINSAGNIGTVQAAGLSGSKLYAGVSGLVAGQTLPTTSAQLSSAVLRVLTLSGRGTSAADVNSAIAAGIIGQLNLGTIQTANGGVRFGVAAHLIASLVGTDVSTRKHLALRKLNSASNTSAMLAGEGISGQDLIVQVM
ncbi:MAG TPA: fibronectin type III domain-containing protein, partial [Tepidisphaeraceae bacterium]|nr:fibronectin type III domain-containing protein [Tepidisphaeraceae bacterium]